MKKAGIILLTSFFIISIFSNSFSQTKQPEPVRRIVYEVHPDEWYQQQTQLWKKEIDNNPQDAKAWHNYYNAIRYEDFGNLSRSKEKAKKLEQIVKKLGQHLPNSWEYHYLKFFNSGHDVKKFSELEKAYKIDPTRADVFYEFISHYAITGDETNINKFYKKLYDSQDISPQLVNYNYNVLMSTDKNSILFTNGDNDTYPARMLQEAKGIRTDVTILNASLSTAGTYLERNLKKIGIHIKRDKIFKRAVKIEKNGKKSFSPYDYFKIMLEEILAQKPEIPIYFASTLYQKYYENIKDNTYIVGLAFRYSKERIDNVAFIKKNFEKRYRLDYLKNNWYTEDKAINSIMTNLNNNYVPPLIILGEHYKNSGEIEKIKEIEDLIYKIAYASGRREMIDYFESKLK